MLLCCVVSCRDILRCVAMPGLYFTLLLFLASLGTVAKPAPQQQLQLDQDVCRCNC